MTPALCVIDLSQPVFQAPAAHLCALEVQAYVTPFDLAGVMGCAFVAGIAACVVWTVVLRKCDQRRTLRPQAATRDAGR